MRYPARIPFLLFLTCVLVSCLGGQSGQPVPLLTAETPVKSPSILPSVQNSPAVASVPPTNQVVATVPTSPPTASPATASPVAQRQQYHLIAELDYDRHFLSVRQDILYTNQTQEQIPDLLFLIEPSRYPGAFKLLSLSIAGRPPVDDYQREIGSLRVPLPDPLFPGETLHISLEYDLNIPSPDPAYYGKPVPFGYSDRQTNLVDWYPFLPPYIPGQGWLAHPVAPFGEYLVYESADFQVDIHILPAGRDLIVAASSLPEKDGEWLHYRHESARTFAWSVSDQYQVFTTQVGSTEVLSYAFSSGAQASRAALEATAEALALFSRLYGAYPRRSLSVVEADFLDGMEYDGLYFLSKGFYNLYSGTPADYLTAIAAHETAHQWWYGLVGNDQALEPWLDEALCTYSERLYYENLHPEALDWWWTYRVNYYEPQGWVDGSVYNPDGYRAYRDAVYLNGALFLEDLRTQIGEEAFFEFWPAYAHKFAFKFSSTEQFFNLLGEISSADLTSLKAEYFNHPY